MRGELVKPMCLLNYLAHKMVTNVKRVFHRVFWVFFAFWLSFCAAHKVQVAEGKESQVHTRQNSWLWETNKNPEICQQIHRQTPDWLLETVFQQDKMVQVYYGGFHYKVWIRIKELLWQVKTIFACHVTQRPARFDNEVKGFSWLSHRLILSQVLGGCSLIIEIMPALFIQVRTITPLRYGFH